MDKDNYVVVIGASNIDIGGTAYKKLIRADSNRGKITLDFGGVGRNIAHNLALLGVNVFLISAVGDDIIGKEIIKHCENAGIRTDHIKIIDKCNSSIYIYINNCSGDMEIAMSQVDIADNITPQYLDSLKDVINGAQAVITDCNITQDSILHLKEICKVPLYIDPVSVTHASKIKGNLKGIHSIKPNILEAEYLSDIKINDEGDYKKAAKSIIEQGVEKVFISLGEKGMIAADKNDIFFTERYPADVLCTTGAGDAASAAILWSDISLGKNDIINESKAANAAASITIESDKTINPELSETAIINRISNNKVSVHKL